jgi:hypothetical protein
MDKDGLCKKVLEIDSRIRFTGFVNENGKLVVGGMKPGFKSLSDSTDNEMIYIELSMAAKMRTDLDKAFGPVKFVMLYRDMLIIMIFPVNDGGIFLISVEKEVDFSKLPFKILEVIHSEN